MSKSGITAPGRLKAVPQTPVAIKVKNTSPSLGSMADAMAWLLDRVDVERINPSRLQADTLKLDRMHALMAALDHPHKAFKSVHVTGTKGKGSTCAMAAAGLEGCGYTVGLYTSPHLVDVRERVRINKAMIDEQAFVRMTQRVADAAAKLAETDAGEPTFFELMTALAFCHFAEEAVDVAVVEVGLGGRLDSTNVIVPEVCAVTNISMDHWQILGDTVEKIALEKAGIFKPGVPALVIDQKPSVIEVFREAAAAIGAPLRVVGKDVDYSVRFEASAVGAGKAGASPQMRVSVSGAGGKNSYEHVAVPLRGEHQAPNCGLALAIMDALSAREFNTPENLVTQGLKTVEFPGRMELLKTTPRVLLDGAHNAESMKMLMKSIGSQIAYDSMVVIFGCAADKDIDGMLREIALGADKVIFTKSGNARAADPRDLARKFNEASGKMCQTAPDFAAALELARRAVGRDDLICVTGSFYLVGEAKSRLGPAPKAAASGRTPR